MAVARTWGDRRSLSDDIEKERVEEDSSGERERGEEKVEGKRAAIDGVAMEEG